MKRWIWIVLTVTWMVVIFLFSSQDGEHSSETSGRIVSIVQKVAYPEWSDLSMEEYQSEMSQLTFFIRKVGHFTEYAILGLLIAMVFTTFKMARWKMGALGVALGGIYAVSDEIHQSFISDRSAKIFDVCIDTAGVFVGCLITLGLCAMVREYRLAKTSR